MRSGRIDLYAVLGVARSATHAELRRAYRHLALRHHPDRAGAASAEIFAGIADAYRVLSNPVARSAYDASLADAAAWAVRGGSPVHTGGVEWTVETNGWRASRPVPVPNLLPRVSGRLEDLLASRVAGRGEDGVIELYLNRREAVSGGTAAVAMSLKLMCATCGGVARPRGVWCRTCEYEGSLMEEVTAHVRVAPQTHPGTVTNVAVPRALEPVRIRFFVRGLRPYRGDGDTADELDE